MHKRTSIIRTLLLHSLLIAINAPAIAQHHHHKDEAVSTTALLKLGSVDFPNSCTASVQAPFNRGVAMLHSFWYEEARKQFLSVAQADPSCAMTEWRPFWDGLPDERRKSGVAEIDAATALHPRTERERQYITALSGLSPLRLITQCD